MVRGQAKVRIAALDGSVCEDHTDVVRLRARCAVSSPKGLHSAFSLARSPNCEDCFQRPHDSALQRATLGGAPQSAAAWWCGPQRECVFPTPKRNCPSLRRLLLRRHRSLDLHRRVPTLLPGPLDWRRQRAYRLVLRMRDRRSHEGRWTSPLFNCQVDAIPLESHPSSGQQAPGRSAPGHARQRRRHRRTGPGAGDVRPRARRTDL
jgi:hypothetical protein